ncbi:MAG: DUF3768 domain-containing protein [Pseudomonadota bacterium]
MGAIDDDPLGAIGAVPVCATCGSERVAVDAFACWNRDSGLWELEAVFEHAHCHRCEGSTILRWTRPEEAGGRSAIRELNDAFRCQGRGPGTVLITVGVQATGGTFVAAALQAVRSFDAFSPENDPWGEHDFGAVEIDGQRVFFKIDCYDRTQTVGSPNPANPAVTYRVLTIMLADEY